MTGSIAANLAAAVAATSRADSQSFYPLRVPISCTRCAARITEVTRDTFVAMHMHCPDCGADWVVPVPSESS